MRRLIITALGLALAGSFGCSKEPAHHRSIQDKGPGEVSTTTTTAAAPAANPVVDPPKPAVHVELRIESTANTMKFDKAELTAPAGAEVHLVFKNNATMTTLPHNWALVKPGTEASVAASGLKAGQGVGYLDQSDKNLLISTPL